MHRIHIYPPWSICDCAWLALTRVEDKVRRRGEYQEGTLRRD